MGMMFTFFAGIAAMAMSLFKCTPNPNGTKSLVADRVVICYESDWSDMLIIAILSVLLWCVGFGGLFLRAVITSSRYFVDPNWRMRWKFLFIKFRPDVHWWCMVFVAKGTLLNLSVVVFTDGVTQLYFIMWLLTFYQALVVVFRPWRHRVVNVADSSAHMCLIVSCSYMTWFARETLENPNSLDSTIAVLVIIAAILCLPICLVCGAFIAWEQTSETSLKMKEAQAKGIQDACKRLAACSADEYSAFMENLGEWDFWFLLSAKHTIHTELTNVACRSGYSTKSLSKETPPLPETSAPTQGQQIYI
jgi:hypothetical protein